MGIRLDWEIESEPPDAHTAREDPSVSIRRRRSRIRLLILILVIFGAGMGLLAFVSIRLQEADAQIEQVLRNTVEAEVAALRIGDQAAFLQLQRSASDEWLLAQRTAFENYQELKENTEINLTGTIRGLTIAGTRARVLVEEIINGVPYVQAWFYWRYDDGWRHVPPDTTFWGELQAYQGQDVTVGYRDLDEPLAREMGLRIEGWIADTCGTVLQCGDIPHITIDIVTDGLQEPQWDVTNRWRMVLPSPFLSRARFDQPFSGELLRQIATLIAERLVHESSSSPDVQTADMVYLRRAAQNWLIGRFTMTNTDSHLMTSIAANYGQDGIGRVLRAITPETTINVLAEVLGLPNLAESNLDWRDYLTWRLELEAELYQRDSVDDYAALYTPAQNELARQRYESGAVEPGVVVLAEKSTADDSTPELLATVQHTVDGNVTQEQVLFQLIDGVWLRAS